MVACQEMDGMKTKESRDVEDTAGDGSPPKPPRKLPAVKDVSDCVDKVKEALKNVSDVLKEAHGTVDAGAEQSLEHCPKGDGGNAEAVSDQARKDKDAKDCLDSPQNVSNTQEVADQTKEAKKESEGVSESLKKTVDSGHQMTYLVKLTASLQTSLFMWCWQQLDTKSIQENEKLCNLINKIIKDCKFYSIFLVNLIKNASVIKFVSICILNKCVITFCCFFLGFAGTVYIVLCKLIFTCSQCLNDVEA